MLTRSQETGMFCFFISLALVVVGFYIRKKEKTEWIPGYKKKLGENTAAYCALVGKGIQFVGLGMFLLSVPISLAEPNKFFALSCLLSCFVFIGIGLGMYLQAEKRYRP